MKNVFSEKVVIITGGASGIGRAIALQLAGPRVTIVIIDRDEAKGGEIARMLAEAGCAAQFLCSDMHNKYEAARAFREIEQQYDVIDYVINSAGEFMGGEMRDTPAEDARKVINNSIMSIIYGSQFAYNIMLCQKHGHIVNLGSAAGLMPIPGMGIYGATKYAVGGYTHALRNEARSLGVKVSLVCPTIVDTPLYDTATYTRIDKKLVLERRKKFQRVDDTAAKIITGIRKNKATIHTSYTAEGISLVYRIGTATV